MVRLRSTSRVPSPPQIRRRSRTTSTSSSPKKVKTEKASADAIIAAGPDAAAPGQSFAQKLLVRVVFGVILGFGFLGLMWTDHHLVAMLLVLGQVLAWKELVSLRYNINKEKEIGYEWFRTLNWYLFGVAFNYFYGLRIASELTVLRAPFGTWAQNLVKYHTGVNFLLYVIAFVGFILTLKRGSLKYQITNLGWTLLTLLLVVAQSHFAINKVYDGLIWLLAPHGLIIINDIMAYVFGVIWGRKIFGDRPLTALSPNKTWEGFLGAAVSTTVIGFFLAPIFGSIPWLLCPAGTWDAAIGGCPGDMLPLFDYTETYNVFDLATVTIMPFQRITVVLALFASIIGPFGGFLASGIKRAFNKKDFNDSIPGHGGLMDRADCQFLMALFMEIYFVLFIQPPANSRDVLLAGVLALPLVDQKAILTALTAAVNGAKTATA